MDLLTTARHLRRLGDARLLPVAAALVGAAVGAAAVRHLPAATPPWDALAPPSSTRSATLLVVAQPADCASRFDALAVVARAAARSGAALEVLVPGGAPARHRVAQQLAGAGHPLRVREASAATLRAVRALGYRTTPLLLVLDARRRLRLAAPLPATVEALRQWHSLVPAALGP